MPIKGDIEFFLILQDNMIKHCVPPDKGKAEKRISQYNMIALLALV